jgi:hypothetical protein
VRRRVLRGRIAVLRFWRGWVLGWCIWRLCVSVVVVVSYCVARRGDDGEVVRWMVAL